MSDENDPRETYYTTKKLFWGSLGAINWIVNVSSLTAQYEKGLGMIL